MLAFFILKKNSYTENILKTFILYSLFYIQNEMY